MDITKKHTSVDSKEKRPVDSELIGVSYIFADDFIQSSLRDLCEKANISFVSYEILYIRYKQSTSCVVTYKVDTVDKINGSKTENYYYAKAYSVDNYEPAKEKALGLHCKEKQADKNVIYFDKERIIFYPFSEDTELQSLDSLLDARKIRRVIYENDPYFQKDTYRISHKKMIYSIVRYKPEKRALIKLETECTQLETGNKETIRYYIKSDTSKRGEDVSRLLSTIALKIPEVIAPIYFDNQKQFMIFKEIKADDVSSLIETPHFSKINKMTALLLSDIHSSKVDIGSFKDIKDDYKSTAYALLEILPNAKNIVEDILSEIDTHLEKQINSQQVLLHGDVSYEQILYSEENICLLDFDRFSFGDPTEDIGNYIAHLVYKEIHSSKFDSSKYIAEFVSAYCQKSNDTINRNILTSWLAISLLQLSVKPFRLYENNWDEKILKTLKVVLDVFKDRTTYGI